MNELEQIKKDIQEIKDRNERVEVNKAWEASLFRKVLITILTYIVIVIFFLFAGLPKPFLSAIVPTLRFLLSTASIPFFKKLWIKRYKK